jgi:hypothetical protein
VNICDLPAAFSIQHSALIQIQHSAFSSQQQQQHLPQASIVTFGVVSEEVRV